MRRIVQRYQHLREANANLVDPGPGADKGLPWRQPRARQGNPLAQPPVVAGASRALAGAHGADRLDQTCRLVGAVLGEHRIGARGAGARRAIPVPARPAPRASPQWGPQDRAGEPGPHGRGSGRQVTGNAEVLGEDMPAGRDQVAPLDPHRRKAVEGLGEAGLTGS